MSSVRIRSPAFDARCHAVPGVVLFACPRPKGDTEIAVDRGGRNRHLIACWLASEYRRQTPCLATRLVPRLPNVPPISMMSLPMTKLVSILLTLALAWHAAAGLQGERAVWCLGGGDRHAPSSQTDCEHACGHDTSWPTGIPAGEHAPDCGCTDIEFAVGEWFSSTRNDASPSVVLCAAPVSAWAIVLVDAGLGQRGPPAQPPWFDPRQSSNLAIVTSTQLLL